MPRFGCTRTCFRYATVLLLLFVCIVAPCRESLSVRAEEEERIVYLSSVDVEGERDGSLQYPYSTLYDAFLALSDRPDPSNSQVMKTQSGGRIVVLDSVTVSAAQMQSETIALPAHENAVTVTGEEGASLVFEESVFFTTLLLGGKTVFDDILVVSETNTTIAANGHDLTFTENFRSDISEGSLYVSGTNHGITRIYGGTFSTVWASDISGCVPDEQDNIEPADSILLFGKNATVTGMLFGAGANRSFTGHILIVLEGGNAGHVYGGGQNIPFHGDTQIWIAGNVTATVNGGGFGTNGTVDGKRYIYEVVFYPYPQYQLSHYDVWMGVKERESAETFAEGVVLKSYTLYQPSSEGEESADEPVSGLCALPIINGSDVRLFRVDRDGLTRVFYERIYGYFSFRAIPGDYVLLETGDLTGLEGLAPGAEVEEDDRTPGEIINDAGASAGEGNDADEIDDHPLSIGWLVLIVLLSMGAMIALILYLFHRMHFRLRL